MTVRTEERKQFLMDVFTTALEGGIGYWSEASAYHWRNDDGTDDVDGFFATVIETEEDDTELRIDMSVVSKGINLVMDGKTNVADDYVKRIKEASRENDAGEIDASDADIIVQAGLFGEVVYG